MGINKQKLAEIDRKIALKYADIKRLNSEKLAVALKSK